MKRIALLVISAVLLLAGCEEGVSPVYLLGELRVEGTVTHADIRCQYFGGVGFHELLNSPLPWTQTSEQVRSGDDFYLSAQSNDAVGDLTVTVLIDGIPIATETSSVAFGFVAVYGTVP